MNKIITTTFPGKYKTHYDLTGRSQYHRAVKARYIFCNLLQKPMVLHCSLSQKKNN